MSTERSISEDVAHLCCNLKPEYFSPLLIMLGSSAELIVERNISKGCPACDDV